MQCVNGGFLSAKSGGLKRRVNDMIHCLEAASIKITQHELCDAVSLQARNHVLPLMMRLPHLQRRMISRAGRADGGGQISGQQQKSDDVVVAADLSTAKSKGLPTKLGLLFPFLALPRLSTFCAMRVASNA